MVDGVDVAVPAVSLRPIGLAADPQPGREQLAHEMILGCLPLVESIARRIYGALPPNTCVDLHDLAQSGLLGLVSAGQGYDPATAVPFPVFARYRIEGEMLDSLRRQDVAPRRLRRWQKQVSAARQEMVSELNREPTEEELCDRLMISAVEMRSRKLALSRTTAPAARDEGGSPDPVSGPETHPDHICSQRQLREVLDRLIDTLPARHQQVIRLHYCRHMTMRQIGSELSVNESRVSQVHRSALQAMGRMLRDFGICSSADV
jgi:RNA polymerase sigma factor for flagellar operon FliA